MPLSLGKKIFDAAGSKAKRFFEIGGGDHNDPEPPEYDVALGEFLTALDTRELGTRE